MTKIDQKIFKAYDIRGTYPDQLNEEIAYKVGRTLVEYLSYGPCGKPKNVAVGRDMRLSSPKLHEALTKGIIESGCDVIDIGLVSTDCLYFAVGKFGYDAGVMITASHNPKEYNGMKMCKKEAIPLSGKEGIEQINSKLLLLRETKWVILFCYVFEFSKLFDVWIKEREYYVETD